MTTADMADFCDMEPSPEESAGTQPILGKPDQRLAATLWHHPRRLWVAASAAALVLLASGARLFRPHRFLVHHSNVDIASEISLSESKSQEDCCMMEKDTDNKCPELPYNFAQIPDAATCCSICEQDLTCGAWTWVERGSMPGVSKMCLLKSWRSGCYSSKVSKPGATSGLPPRKAKLIHKPKETPKEKPKAKDKPAEKPTEKKTETTTEQPTNNQTEKPTEKPTAEPEDKPKEKPLEKPEEKRAEKNAEGKLKKDDPRERKDGAGGSSTSAIVDGGPKHDPSLFCFALILPWGYDLGLAELQHRYSTSVFACDAYALYSNESIQVAEGVRTHLVKSDLRTYQGRDFKTPLNINVFMVVWWEVVRGKEFLHHDWTVKVQPDTVFFPTRLRAILGHYRDGLNGVYLNNCHRGLHGGLEVFSRKAVMKWSTGTLNCQKLFQHECDGPCGWLEDTFIDQCLGKVLAVKRENVYDILVDGHCNPPEDWMVCGDTSAVAFHPLTDIGAYTQCLLLAGSP